MSVSEHQLRQLLAERSGPALKRPVPQDRIATRIRWARLRRRAGAGLLAAVAVAGVVTGVNLTHQPAPEPAVSSGGPFPASFTAADGAAYRRLNVVAMTKPAQRSVTLTLTAGQDPLDVMSDCASHGGSAYVRVEVNGVAAGGFACRAHSQLIGLPVLPGRAARITFTRTTGGNDPDNSASWRFAVYSWTPPAVARPAPALPRLPLSYTGPNMTTGQGTALRRLVASRDGVWASQRTATFTLTFHGRSLDVSMFCTGAIASRLRVSLQVGGVPGQEMSCLPWIPGGQAQDSTSVNGTPGQQITLTFRIQAPSYAAADYTTRVASWIVDVYEEEF